MADAKISALTNYTTPIGTDVLPIVDVTNGITIKIALSILQPAAVAFPAIASLVSYYNLEGTPNDVWMNVNPGVATAVSYGYAYGKIGQGGSFNGTSSIIVVNSPSGVPIGSSARSISAWIKTTLVSSWVSLFGYGTYATGEMFFLGVNGGKSFFSGDGADVTGSVTVNDRNWHHLVVTYNGTTVKIYVDGVFDSSGTPFLNTVLGKIGIGGIPGTNYQVVDIDECGIWSVELTQAQITTLYNNGYGLSLV